jgi:hypothetical protein
MDLFKGKTPAERNKIIAAGVLGLLSLVALYLAFGRGSSSSTTTVTVRTSPTPRPATSTGTNAAALSLPSPDEQTLAYESTPVVYTPGSSYAPDAGRNIFAFYEPPPPTPWVYVPPKPTATPTPKPTPVPTPLPFTLASANPGVVYAGSKPFRLEVVGDKFSPDAKIYFNQVQMPTTFVSPQRLTTDVPANLISQEGPRQVIVQTPDGTKYSNQMMFQVQAPPKPTVQYIGMVGRKRYNNDTAYFTDPSRGQTPFTARLNDVVNGRFRVIDISPAEVVVEDVNLGFKHRVAIQKVAAQTGVPGAPGGFVPGVPPGVTIRQPQPQRPPNPNQDVDDDDPPRP